MTITALGAPTPAGLDQITARIDALHNRMGTTITGSRFATVMASASGPLTATGDDPATGLLNPASIPGQGMPAVLRPAALTAAGTTADGVNAKAAGAITEAKKYLGTMYQWGGEDPSTGFDCSGLLQWAYKQQGVAIPRTTYDQVNAGRAVPVNEASLRPGDLLFLNYRAGRPEHVVMWLGDGKVIEAPKTGKPVRIRDIDLSTVGAARRVVPDPVTPAGAPASVAAASQASSASWAAALPAKAAPYVTQISAAAKREGIEPAALAAVLWHESNFNADAKSPAGAIGLGQLMPGTAAELGVNPHDPAQNINGAAKYLAKQMRDFGSLEMAAAAYNAGPGAVRKFGGVPPYAETRNYVTDVSAKYNRLRGAR